YGLALLSDEVYQNQLSEMDGMWQDIKLEIYKVRKGESKTELYRLSEDYFTRANEMVATAQEISDNKTYTSMQVFGVYLVLTVGVFIIWYKYKQRQIKKALYIDELTGISNYTGFEMELKDRLEYADTTSMALLYLDIDDFKYLNSFYGNHIGNQLLRTMAWTFQEYVGSKGCCGRYGNDQFLLLCENSTQVIDEIKENIKKNMKQSIELDLYNDLSICVGIYRIQKDKTVNDIIDNASLAHKHAKKLGKGTVLYYNQELLDQLYYESKLTNQMHKALKDKEFKLYLQPKFEIPSLKVVGAEALVRWQDEDHKLLYPDEFIPVFEQNGFISKLDFFVWEE
ncbi:MAG: diguanylate cyclase, partial [Coprobacillus sp.]